MTALLVSLDLNKPGAGAPPRSGAAVIAVSGRHPALSIAEKNESEDLSQGLIPYVILSRMAEGEYIIQSRKLVH
jgi:hypothetical protein